MIWPFNRRRRYNSEVASLLPALAVDVDEAGPIKALDVLDIAWAEGFTPYEAALLVAYSVAGGLAGGGYIYRSQDMIRQTIRPLQEDWLKKGIVRLDVVRGWYPKAEESLRKHRESSRWPGPPGGPKTTRGPAAPAPVVPFVVPVSPDITSKDPVRRFRLDGHVCLLVRDVGPYVDPDYLVEAPGVRFPFVLGMRSPRDEDNFYMVALEQPVHGYPRMVEFPRIEERRSRGIVPGPVDEEWFIQEAMRLTALQFKLDSHWQELPPPLASWTGFGIPAGGIDAASR